MRRALAHDDIPHLQLAWFAFTWADVLQNSTQRALMPVEEILSVVGELVDLGDVIEALYKGVFKRLFHATGRLFIRAFTFDRVKVLPNKRAHRRSEPLRPQKTDSFAVFLGLVFWASFTGLFCYWYFYA